jgi:hypothetical protein
MADQQQIAKGDAVLHEGTLYRVLKNQSGILTLENVNGSKMAAVDDCTYVAVDTLSGIPDKTSKVKYRWRSGDFVQNTKLGLWGEVMENKDGKTRVEVIRTDGTAKYYWWPQDEMITYVPGYRKGNGSTSNWDWIGDSSTRRTASPKPEKPKEKPLGISTAGLIKSEVSKLEKEQKTRPLKTDVPKRDRSDDDAEDDDSILGPSKPVPKRRGEW